MFFTNSGPDTVVLPNLIMVANSPLILKWNKSGLRESLINRALMSRKSRDFTVLYFLMSSSNLFFNKKQDCVSCENDEGSSPFIGQGQCEFFVFLNNLYLGFSSCIYFSSYFIISLILVGTFFHFYPLPPVSCGYCYGFWIRIK